MKKTIGLISAIALASGLFMIGCGGAGLDQQIEGKSYRTEGWIDPHTFRTTAMGVPKSGEQNTTKRKIQAKEAAILMAQKTILEKFKGARLKGASGAADGELTGIAIAKEFGGMVKGGSVVKVTYNDSQEAEVVYEVRAKNLKKKVMFGVE